MILRKMCMMCGKIHHIKMTDLEYSRLLDGELIQEVFPNMSPQERELIISGTCPACWDELFKEEEE